MLGNREVCTGQCSATRRYLVASGSCVETVQTGDHAVGVGSSRTNGLWWIRANVGHGRTAQAIDCIDASGRSLMRAQGLRHGGGEKECGKGEEEEHFCEGGSGRERYLPTGE